MKSIKVCEYSRSRSFHDDLILQDQASGERSQDQWSSGYTPPLKKVLGIMLYPPKKICVRVSVHVSVCPSVRQRFVSGLYLQHSLTDFLQTLYSSSYQEGVVLD